MEQNLLNSIEAFKQETGLSDHRIGILLAKNGRLLQRLREGKRLWPDTKANIRIALRRETASRISKTPEATQ